MELRICDFRNAKFQGQTINKQPEGFGFLLDQNYTFVISEWKRSSIDGPFACIFGDSFHIYGDSFNDQNSLMIYSGNQVKIFKNIQNTVVDCVNSKFLLKLQTANETLKSKQKGNSGNKITVSLQRKYSQQNYIKILSQLLQQRSIQKKYLSLKQFIKDTFKGKHKDLLSFYQSTKYLNISLKNQGIFIKMTKKMDYVLSVGVSGPGKQQDIGRKYIYQREYAGSLVQQFIQTEPQSSIQFHISNISCKNRKQLLKNVLKINSTSFRQQGRYLEQKQPNNQKQRPIQCLKSLREYYKRSLTFINKYINLQKMYKKKQKMEEISRQVLFMNGEKYAQVQLQNNGYELDKNEQPIINQKNRVIPYQASLEDLKKQLSKTVNGWTQRKSPNNNILYAQIDNIQAKALQITASTIGKTYNEHRYQRKTSISRRVNEVSPNTQKYYKQNKNRSQRVIKYLDQPMQPIYLASSLLKSRNQTDNIKRTPTRNKYNYTQYDQNY